MRTRAPTGPSAGIVFPPLEVTMTAELPIFGGTSPFPGWPLAATDQTTAWALLDRAHRQMLDESVFDGLNTLYFGLHDIRRRMTPELWLEFCGKARREHDVRDIVYQSP